jgi:putative CocE/NonD family hydrolase
MGENAWRDESEWPLARTRWTSLYLRAGDRVGADGGQLLLELPAAEAPDTFTYDPSDPVPTCGGARTFVGVPGPLDQRDIEARHDVCVYTSPVLLESVEVTGPVSLELWVSSSAIDTDFTAKLVDVHPDGAALHICEGAVRVRHSATVDGLLQPGAVYRVPIDLWATSNVFKPGHRIRLDVSSSSFPRIDANPNHGQDGDRAERVTAIQTIYHDALHPSRLILPYIPRDGAIEPGLAHQ